KGGLRNGPEVLVAPHEAVEPRVLELLLTPERGQSSGVARDGPAHVDDRVDVEQRPIRVEEQSLHLHVFPSIAAAALLPAEPSPYNEARCRGSSPPADLDT